MFSFDLGTELSYEVMEGISEFETVPVGSESRGERMKMNVADKRESEMIITFAAFGHANCACCEVESWKDVSLHYHWKTTKRAGSGQPV